MLAEVRAPFFLYFPLIACVYALFVVCFECLACICVMYSRDEKLFIIRALFTYDCENICMNM